MAAAVAVVAMAVASTAAGQVTGAEPTTRTIAPDSEPSP